MSKTSFGKTNNRAKLEKRFPLFKRFSVVLLLASIFTGWSLHLIVRKGEPVASNMKIQITVGDVRLENPGENSTSISSASRSWNEYRIGDGIAMHHGAPGCEAFPDSIVCAYLQHIDQPNNISALIKVLGDRSTIRTNRDVALVHARLGDGLCAMVDERCRGNRSGVPDCWNDDKDCWLDVDISRQYAYSKYWYFSVVSELKKLQVKTIIIIGDKFHWTRTPDPRQGNFGVDEAYLDSMAHFFRSSGFGVILQEPNLPDNDFIFLCSAQVFVRGGGGYSALVARVVETRGSVVFAPSKRDDAAEHQTIHLQ
jgi:hypothetical protein